MRVSTAPENPVLQRDDTLNLFGDLVFPASLSLQGRRMARL
jgi:hypothetical protein